MRFAPRVDRVFRLRPGEIGTLGPAVAMAFLGSAGLTIAQSSIDALFFARYGADRLPVLYVLVGVAMFGTTLAFAVLLGRLGRPRTFLLTLAAIAVVAILARVAAARGEGPVYAALWLVYNVGESTELLALWGVAGLIADTRTAKRFFPLIGAGSALGVIVGGTATAPLAAAFGSENLLVVWALLAASAAVLALWLVRTHVEVAHPSRRARSSASSVLLAGFRQVTTSELLRWMAAATLLMSLLFSLLYLPFSASAAARYPDPDELAGFFGLFFAGAMGTAFLLSLLVTSRLLARFGVPVVILILPCLYLTAFGVLTVTAAFVTLAVFRFGQIAWRSGGAGSTWEALVNTLPAERRDRVRAFLTGVPSQLGTIVAGGVAFAAQQLDQPRILYTAGVLGAVLAVGAMWNVRRAYPRALVKALREGRPTVFGAPGAARAALAADAAALDVLAQMVRDPDRSLRRLAVHSLAESGLADARAPLLVAAEDDDEEIRAAALEGLEGVAPVAGVEAARARISDRSPAVRSAALGILWRGGIAPPRELLEDEADEVRAAAAAMLFEDTADAERVLLDMVCHPRVATRVAAIRALGPVQSGRAVPLVQQGLGDPEPAVRAAAVEAVAAQTGRGAVPDLVTALADDDARVRQAAVMSLSSIGPPAAVPVAEALASGVGEGALGALERLPLDGAAPIVRQFAAAAVGRALSDDSLARALDGIDTSEVALLRDSLRARAQRSAINALRAAGVLGNRVAVSAALENLAVTDPAQRAYALEVVETVGEPAIVRPLIALWEPSRENVNDPAVLETLRNDADEWIRLCAELATAAQGGTMAETIPTLATVQRVAFLRRVALFAELPPEDMKPIAAIAEEHVFSEGETIAEHGELGDTLYVIVDGVVRVEDATGAPIATRRAGEVIGEMAVISSRPRVATLVAGSELRVLEIHKPAFEAVLRERPDVALAMMRLFVERLGPQEG
jgi:HEAT repeat protein